MRTAVTKGPALLPVHAIEDLEEKLVAALYEQRSLEFQILEYEPQSSAPQALRDAFCTARERVNQIEARIRALKYGF